MPVWHTGPWGGGMTAEHRPRPLSLRGGLIRGPIGSESDRPAPTRQLRAAPWRQSRRPSISASLPRWQPRPPQAHLHEHWPGTICTPRYSSTHFDGPMQVKEPKSNVTSQHCRRLQADNRGAECTPKSPAACRGASVHTLQCGIDDGAHSSSLTTASQWQHVPA